MRKSKMIIGCIISVMALALTLLIGLPNKVYASATSDYIDEKYSNLVISNNLFSVDMFNKEEGALYTLIDENKNMFRVEQQDVWGNVQFELSVKPDTVYTLSFEQTQLGYVYIWDMVSIDQIYGDGQTTYLKPEITFITPSNCNKISIRFYDNNEEINNISYVMLNYGSQALPYDAYIIGSMIYSQAFQQGLLENATSVLYKAFNGANAQLIYNDSVIISDTINLTENDLYLSINNMTNIMIYLNADETSRKYSLSISLNSAINNELVVLLNNSILDTSLTLSNSLGGYQESFSRAASSLNTIIANSQGRYFDTITYNPLYPPDYINFKLNLDLSQLTFEEGYNSGLDAGIYEGFQQGSEEGYYKGYDAGKADGYNEGYNQGSISNIETNGFKTLFNSILSYPVNMISTVFNFEFMGVNISSLIMFIVSIGIVVFVVKKFW